MPNKRITLNVVLFRNPVKMEGKMKSADAADFETALAATGFGKFNVLLLLVAFTSCWACIFETSTMSYVFPAAQCDLDLSLEDKGMLNAITYIGTLSSGFLWGFLYDIFGRRKLLALGFLLDGSFVVLSGFSQSKTFLMTMKFLGGFMMSGPYAALASYLSELHVVEYRARVPLLMGLANAVGGIYLPIIAGAILPLQLKFVIHDYFVFYSWSLFLWLNALPALISAIFFFYLPESPKFLMSMGKNEEALAVFKRIYHMNTNKTVDTFPIKSLISETKATSTSKSSIKDGFKQMQPLFSAPLLKIFILICTMEIVITMTTNTLRLWLPQFFQTMNDYKILNNGTSTSFCRMLDVLQRKVDHEECFVNLDNFQIYLNLIIVYTISVCCYLIGGLFINKLGKNLLMFLTGALTGCFGVGIYFSLNAQLATFCFAGFVGLASLSSNVLLAVIVNLFPTTIRTLTVSLAMGSGRAAAVVGNIIFPYLLELGCGPPFLSLATLAFICAISTVLLPKNNENFS